MKNKITAFNNEVKTTWNFIGLLVGIVAPVLLILSALEVDGVLRIAFAVTAAVLLVDVLAKLYNLIRK